MANSPRGYINKLKRAALILVFSALCVVTLSLSMILTNNLDTVFKSPETISPHTDNPSSYEAPAIISDNTISNTVSDNLDEYLRPTPRKSGLKNTERTWHIRDYNGKIGVFCCDDTGIASDTPEYILDIYVFTLPRSEAALLRKGITVTESEMRYLIDAYTS